MTSLFPEFASKASAKNAKAKRGRRLKAGECCPTCGQKLRSKSRKRITAAELLEYYSNMFVAVGFECFKSMKEFTQAEECGRLPERYVVLKYKYLTKFSPKQGNKEAFIRWPHNGRGPFVPSLDGIVEIILEAKRQDGSGTADEKLASTVWEPFLESKIINWILLFGGEWWKHGRGLIFRKDYEARANGVQSSRYILPKDNRHLEVTDTELLPKLVRDIFSQSGD